MTTDNNISKENESTDENYVIETFNLTKRYKLRGKAERLTALNSINLKVNEGEIFGLLGPNGAGKTTLVSILTSLIPPTEGFAKVLGKNVLKEQYFIKKNVGLMLGSDMIYYRLTGYRNLKFFCKIYNINDYEKKIKDIVELLGLTSKLNQLVETYSSGMKVKLALARILLIDPKILFLDEPMLGLDPKTANSIVDILKKFNKTIFLTSHQMNIVESLCDRIAFLREGQIIKVDSKENFKNIVKGETKIQISVSDNRKNDLVKTLSNLEFVNNLKVENGNILFSLVSKSNYPNLFDVLSNFPITKFREIETDLEDVFIKLSS
ncbi:MAG: ABC transporter ATP-binding protein [Candidatus Lokiarchaeota archaeon]|nr:ABC transporter ATP-binding protein [Candidatus Lokiarchaeota archaeon]